MCGEKGRDVSEVESMDREQVRGKKGVVLEETAGWRGEGETSDAPRGWVWNDDEGTVRCLKLRDLAIAFLGENLGAQWEKVVLGGGI
jgi:hypothetical protein